MEHVKSEEAGSIRTRFQTPSEVKDNPSSESETINEKPYDLDLPDTEIKRRIVERSAQLADQLKQLRS